MSDVVSNVEYEARILTKAIAILRCRSTATTTAAAGDKEAQRKQRRIDAAARRRAEIVRKREEETAEAARVAARQALFETMLPTFELDLAAPRAAIAALDREIAALRSQRYQHEQTVHKIRKTFQPFCVHDYTGPQTDGYWNKSCKICGYEHEIREYRGN